MKRFLLTLIICMLCFVGCSKEGDTGNGTQEVVSKKYSIGDEIDLAGTMFNVYKVDDDNHELYLMAQSNIAATPFSNSEREQKYFHNYEGSLIEGYVNRFVDDLEDVGIVIKSSGIIDKDDLCDLGFEIDGLNGSRYKIGDTPNFIKIEDNFWVDGYCRYDTFAWAYRYGFLETDKCEKEYGVRPVIVIDVSEVDKPLQKEDDD